MTASSRRAPESPASSGPTSEPQMLSVVAQLLEWFRDSQRFQAPSSAGLKERR